MQLSKGKLCSTSAVIAAVCGRLAWPAWFQCVPDSHWLFSCARPNATGELCVTMTNHSLCAPPSGWWRSGREGWLTSRLPLFSQLLPSCMSLHVFSCLCCVDADSSVAAATTHFTVYTKKMNQLTVANVLFSPDLDVLHSSTMSGLCPCVLATVAVVAVISFFLAANLQQIYTKSHLWQLPLETTVSTVVAFFFLFCKTDTQFVSCSPDLRYLLSSCLMFSHCFFRLHDCDAFSRAPSAVHSAFLPHSAAWLSKTVRCRSENHHPNTLAGEGREGKARRLPV